jgi:hypothetical protein
LGISKKDTKSISTSAPGTNATIQAIHHKSEAFIQF